MATHPFWMIRAKPRRVRLRAMSSVGDRVERAIEDRADVEHEIERGEASPPQRAKLVKRVLLAGRDRRLALPRRAEPDRRVRLVGRPRQARRRVAGRDGRPADAGARVPVAAPAPRDARPVVAGGRQLAARRQCAREDRARRRRARRRAAVPHARPGGAARQPRDGGPHGDQPADLRRRPGAAGAGRARDPPRRRQPRPARGRGHRHRRARGAVRDRHGAGRLRPARSSGSAASSSVSATGSAAAPSRCGGCPSGCCASGSGSSGRSARAGSARWRPPAAAGRSTTRRCSPR